jgi:hypothetical protein
LALSAIAALVKLFPRKLFLRGNAPICQHLLFHRQLLFQILIPGQEAMAILAVASIRSRSFENRSQCSLKHFLPNPLVWNK